ncbi:MAG: ATP synthase subunit I [Acidobacteriota bacterium]
MLESAASRWAVKAAYNNLVSDNSPSNDDESLALTAPEAVERRVWRNIFAVVAIAVVIAALAADLKFMLGLVLGGGLALLNYKWLHSSLRAVVGAGNEKAPPGTMIKFVVRWLVIAAVAWAANKTGYFDAIAILAGLLAPAAAVMIEAAYVAYKTFRTRENDH